MHNKYSRLQKLTLPLMCLWIALTSGCQPNELSEREQKRLISLGLRSLAAATDNSNRVVHDPRARQLGEQLFFDTRLSSSNNASCASCHLPAKGFTDGLARAEFLHNQDSDLPKLRNTPTIVGAAWSRWQYWDGRRDSLWSQALTPIESPVEMNNNRVAVARLLLNDQSYLAQYKSIFGAFPLNQQDLTIEASPMADQASRGQWYKLPKPLQTKINTVFANVGKAIAAYQTTLVPAPTRFDQFLDKLASGEGYLGFLTDQEYEGARLFVNDKKTQCMECHNGPLLSNHDFHNIGSSTTTGDNIDLGRMLGVQAAMLDEFNCHGRFSDAAPDQCLHMNFMNRNDLVHSQGGYKTPTLRNVANTGPYFHDGRFQTLRQVVRHYQIIPDTTLQTELRPFPLKKSEIKALVAFMKTLTPITQQ